MKHLQYDDANNAYKQCGRSILHHLLKTHINEERKAPIASIHLQESSIIKRAFDVLFNISIVLSPQLGVEYKYLQQYVDQFKMSDVVTIYTTIIVICDIIILKYNI